MLSRFFHVRFSSVKPFNTPAAAPSTTEAGSADRPTEVLVCHVDYDRHPLTTSGFDHYIEWNENDERFFVH